MRPPVILRVYKNNQLKEVKQFTIDQIVLGSNSEAQLTLEDDSISPIHCLLESRDNGYYLCDLGSQNGTFKNGQAILDEPIQSGDEIFIGQYKIVFFVGIPKPTTAPSRVEKVPVKEPIKQEIKESVHQQEKIVQVEINEEDDKTQVIDQSPSINTHKEIPLKESKIQKVHDKPKIVSDFVHKNPFRKKKKHSFAPPNEIKNLKSYLTPTKGNVVEVNLIWNERIVQSYHFKHKGVVKVGADSEKQISIPSSAIPLNWPLLEISTAVKVLLPTGSNIEIVNTKSALKEEVLLSAGKAQKLSQAVQVRLDQGEILYANLPDKNLTLSVRFVENTGIVPFAPLLLSSSELGGLALSIIISGMLAFYVATITSKIQPPEEEKTTYTAQVLFNHNKVKEEQLRREMPKPPPEIKPKPPEEEKKSTFG